MFVKSCKKNDFDARRISMTIEYIKKHLDVCDKKCVEIGSLDYPSAKIIWKKFVNADIADTAVDLRYDKLPFDDGSIDCVTCTEVIEHISDRFYEEATTLDGLVFFLQEVYRILKVGGRCLITSPNSNSLWAICRALRCEPPLMYDWHFREYTVDELSRIVKSIGFDVVVHRTEYVWHMWDFSGNPPGN